MQFQASSQMFPPYVLSSALSLITNLVSSFSKPKPRTNGPQKANLPWRLFLPTWFKNAFSQGNVGNSCLYCSVCEKMAFLQSSVALVMAAVSAGAVVVLSERSYLCISVWQKGGWGTGLPFFPGDSDGPTTMRAAAGFVTKFS